MGKALAAISGTPEPYTSNSTIQYPTRQRFAGMTTHSPLSGILPGLFFLILACLSLLQGQVLSPRQALSWLAAALGLWVFARLLALLAPGSRVESRWVFAGLGLAFAPMYLKAGLTGPYESLGLLFVLASLFFFLRTSENKRAQEVVWTAMFAVLAICTQVESAAKQLSLESWSMVNFFKCSFVGSNGELASHFFPNILYLLFPLAHPAFCFLLPGLFFLSKKTDLLLPAKKIILTGMVIYLVFLGGLPWQHLPQLLPAYAFLLLLFFPAWDRFYCYGFVFFPRLTKGLILIALLWQLACCALFN
ncbi:MAG: hypothetical protein ACKVT2_07455 [Saprospiraceae bacterium]